jgi:hypothetical protein
VKNPWCHYPVELGTEKCALKRGHEGRHISNLENAFLALTRALARAEVRAEKAEARVAELEQTLRKQNKGEQK